MYAASLIPNVINKQLKIKNDYEVWRGVMFGSNNSLPVEQFICSVATKVATAHLFRNKYLYTIRVASVL